MIEFVIAKAKVISVTEVSLPAEGTHSAKTVTASKLKIEQLHKEDDPRVSVSGTIDVPTQLPFGKRFALCLCDPDSIETVPNVSRLFKEE